jgi:hypothetical protein
MTRLISQVPSAGYPVRQEGHVSSQDTGTRILYLGRPGTTRNGVIVQSWIRGGKAGHVNGRAQGMEPA